MRDVVKNRASYEDLLAVPEHRVAEIVAGALRTRPRPRIRHARVSSRLCGSLEPPFDRGTEGPGGWIILVEPELHLDSDILVPDLAGWRRATLPELPDDPFLSVAPDWVCEVLSPSTAALDRSEKMPIYAREGVKHLWLIDPDTRLFEAYRLEENKAWQLIGSWHDAAKLRVEPFAEIELELSALWAR